MNIFAPVAAAVPIQEGTAGEYPTRGEGCGLGVMPGYLDEECVTGGLAKVQTKLT
jgi:hypothetical protein